MILTRSPTQGIKRTILEVENEVQDLRYCTAKKLKKVKLPVQVDTQALPGFPAMDSVYEERLQQLLFDQPQKMQLMGRLPLASVPPDPRSGVAQGFFTGAIGCIRCRLGDAFGSTEVGDDPGFGGAPGARASAMQSTSCHCRYQPMSGDATFLMVHYHIT